MKLKGQRLDSLCEIVWTMWPETKPLYGMIFLTTVATDGEERKHIVGEIKWDKLWHRFVWVSKCEVSMLAEHLVDIARDMNKYTDLRRSFDIEERKQRDNYLVRS